MKSFHPDEIVHHVPKLKALLLLRKLLLEMQSDIDNRKDLRRKLYELFSNKERAQEAAGQRELKSYASMRLPTRRLEAAQPPAQPALAAQPTPRRGSRQGLIFPHDLSTPRTCSSWPRKTI